MGYAGEEKGEAVPMSTSHTSTPTGHQKHEFGIVSCPCADETFDSSR